MKLQILVHLTTFLEYNYTFCRYLLHEMLYGNIYGLLSLDYV